MFQVQQGLVTLRCTIVCLFHRHANQCHVSDTGVTVRKSGNYSAASQVCAPRSKLSTVRTCQNGSHEGHEGDEGDEGNESDEGHESNEGDEVIR